MELHNLENNWESKTFLQNYNDNISVIEEQIGKSGIHSINIEKSEEWINAQKNQFRRYLARKLIENTHYITFQESINRIEELVTEFYTDLEPTTIIYLYCDNQNKSFYLFAMLFLRQVKIFKYRNPDSYIGGYTMNLNNTFIQHVNSNQKFKILVLDDFSYSGSQLSGLLSKWYSLIPKDTSTKKINEKYIQPIYIGLIGFTKFSKDKINKIDIIVNGMFGEKTITLKSPYHLLKNITEYKTLDETLTKYECFCIQCLFSPFLTIGHPNISLYLDYKIADEISTFTKVLLFGPIVPKSFQPAQFKYFIINLTQENSKERIEFLKQMIVDDVDTIDDIIENELKLIPFINNCNIPTQPNIPYEFFICPKNCNTNDDNCRATGINDAIKAEIEPENLMLNDLSIVFTFIIHYLVLKSMEIDIISMSSKLLFKNFKISLPDSSITEWNPENYNKFIMENETKIKEWIILYNYIDTFEICPASWYKKMLKGGRIMKIKTKRRRNHNKHSTKRRRKHNKR